MSPSPLTSQVPPRRGLIASLSTVFRPVPSWPSFLSQRTPTLNERFLLRDQTSFRKTDQVLNEFPWLPWRIGVQRMKESELPLAVVFTTG
jgi:hypothetical protein